MSYLLLESGSDLLLEDDVSHILLELVGTPLLITQEYHSALIRTSPSLTAWSIDPERTQQLSELTSPGVTMWSDSYSSKVITSSPTPTPWSIDPERTQEL
jgi:hypothetical protein